MKKLIFAAGLLGGSLLAGCATTMNTPNPYPPVPPPTAEVIPKPPVSAEPLVWQPGFWDWNGGGYVWLPGRYVSTAGHGTLFQMGYWQLTSSGWVWVRAHWAS
jgi:hypothetical protein